MVKLLHQKILKALLIIFLTISPLLRAQVDMSVTGSYTQNFDFPTLPKTNGTLAIDDWYCNTTTLIAANGSVNSGSLYSFGAGTGTTAVINDRALGSICSGSLASAAYGILLKNNSASTITSITVTYTMEQWRNGGVTATQPLAFYFKKSTTALDATGITDNTGWTAVSGLSTTSKTGTTTAAALDGNATANKTTLTNIAIPGLSLASGEYIMLKWYDFNDAGNDHGLSIDDLTINWTVPAANVAPSFTSGAASQTFTYSTAGTYTYGVTGTPTPAITTTLNPSGALPTGMTTGTNTINVGTTVAVGTYDIRINATNSQGSVDKDITLIVNKGNQTIGNFNNIIKVFGDADFTLNATGGSSGETVTYISSDPTVATISGNTVTIIGAGTADITASQAGNSNYNAAADVIRTLTVNKANQTISNFTDITKIFGDADFALSAIGGASGEPITYTSSDTNVATILGNTVTIVGAGTSTITASQAGNSNYNSVSLGHTLTVSKAAQAITFTNITKIYGDADFTLSATGGASGEPITYTSSNTAVATVSGNTVTIISNGTTNITASQTGNTNYAAATDVVRTLTVDAKPITITGLTANNKVYDRNTTATINAASLDALAIVGSDDVALGSYTAAFSDASVDNNKTVAITYQLTGAEAGRYTLTQPTGITADITAKELTIAGLQISDKTYDGTTAANITGTATLNGVISPDVVAVTGTGSASFTDPNPGAAIPVTVTGYALTGASGANYSLLQPQGLTANITSITLQNQTISFGALSNVTYGDANFNLTATATSGLTVTYTSSDSSVATVSGTTVTIVGPGTTTITANQSGDSSYNPAPAVQQQLTVNSKTLTVINAAIADKTYDQTTTAVASGTLSGVINSDSVTLVSAAAFTNDDAGNNIAVTPQYSITGADTAKYTLTQPTVTGNIFPVVLTLTNTAVNNKVYDATTNAVITATLNGVLSGDTVTLNGTGTFASENVANGISVISTATLSGADASNYTFTQPTGLTANITLLSLTVAATANDKAYDRNTNTSITISQVNGVLLGDDVTVSGNGTFNNFNVGTAKPVTANLILTGTDAINYTLTQPTGLTAAITAKNLTIDTAATTVTTKFYNSTTTATLVNPTLIGVVAGDEALVSAVGGSFAQANPGTGIAVNNISLSGSASINYQLTQPTTLTGNILPKELIIAGAAAQNKVYNGNDAAVITGTLSGKIVGDTVTLNGNGTFASPDVANGIAVTSTATLSGADAGNYILTQPTGLTANITAKSLTLTATAVDKIYDQTTVATINNAQIVAAGIIAGDDVSLVSTTVTGTFANATVGNNKNVTATFTLQGSDAANYSVTAPTLQASITPLALTVDVASATVTPKTYDAATSGAVITGAILNGIISGDSVSITGSFATANVGTGINVTLGLTGSSAANYTLTQPSPGLSGEIIKKTLTATADNKTKTQGSANPALTISYSGFAGGQTSATAAGFTAPTTNTTAVTASPAGAYPITIAGGAADNYAISLVNGWLMVNPAATATQILAWDFTGENTGTNSTAEIVNTNLDSSALLTRGSGAAASAGANSFRTVGFQDNGISLSNNDYFQFTISADPTYQLSLSTITAALDGTSSFASTPGVSHQFAYSTNGSTFTLINSPVVTVGQPTTISVDLTGVTALQNVAANTTITFRYYASGQTTTGGWGFKSQNSGDKALAVNGTIVIAPTAPQITSALAASSFVGESEIYQIAASGSPALTLSATNLPAGATIDANGLITFDGSTPAGAYNINLKATSYYGTDNKVLVYTISKENQFLTFTPDPLPTKFASDAPFTISVTNTAPLALTYSSSDTNVATIATDGTITIVGAGTTTITASNTGDAMYNAVSLGKMLTVLPTPQITATPASISFTAIQGQGPSTSVQLTSLDGINLVPASGNITLTASAGFELAMGIGSYGTTASFAYTGGSFNQVMPQIFVRFAAGQAVGTYNGTLTISGGNAIVQIPLSAIVDPAPEINTTAVAFGPYCSGSDNIISLAYTTQGTFSTGSFYVQHSDASGVFPTDFSNIISASATVSPISATLPSTLVAGNYRVRVVHLSSWLVLTSSINDNGSNIIINTTPAPTATALTFCTSATVANLTATGTDLKWYASSNGGTQLVLTDAVTTGNYFVSQTLNNCESTRTQVAVTVNITPAPTATALTFCNAATVANLTATGTDLKWYAASNGGTQLLATDVVSTGDYFVSQTLNNCESTRTQVVVTVNVTPAPTATALTFCTSATVANLTATGTDLKWYAASNGGTQLLATDVVSTGDYFVSQTLNNCESTRTQVAVTVNVTPAPTATALTFCTSATVANLTATGTNLKWYAASNGGSQLLATDVVSTGDYFVSQTLNNCESTRTQVAVTVNVTPAPTATALTFCNSATVANLTATGTDLKWYAASNGGTKLTATDVVTTGDYFVSQTLNNCESTRTQVAVTVNITPAPTATALTFCNAATVANLTATGTDLKWYAASNGGTQLSATDVVTTGNYFVSQTLNNCESTRTQVAVTVNVTPAPTATALTFCTSATVANLTATGTNLKWYAASNGGTQLSATDAVTTGNYFVSQTLNNCESTRIQVAVTVNVTSAPTATALTFCTSATVANLTATGTDLKWYAASNGGMQLLATDAVTSGNYFVSQTLNNCESTRTQVAVTVNVTPAPTGNALTLNNGATVADLTATGTNLKWYSSSNGGSQLSSLMLLTTGSYFVSQTINGCESTRTEIIVTITDPAPPAPIATDHTFCNSATVADLIAEGSNLRWYEIATGGTSLLITDQLTTGNYFVTQTVNNVESTRTEVQVTINVTPMPIISALNFCQPGLVSDLTATGTNLKWYATENDGTELVGNISLVSGSYYVTQTLNNCESARALVPVTINNIAAPQAENLTLCTGSTVADLTANGTNLKWYSLPSDGTAHTPQTVLTAGNYYVSQTVNGCESPRTLVAVTLTTTAMPTAENQTFCAGATVADLLATVTGTEINIYPSLTEPAPLENTTVMVNGNYYVSQAINGCESQRKAVLVTIHSTPAPTGDAEQVFTEEGHTLANLQAEGEGIKWYATEADAIAGVNPLPETTVLVTETTYYATQTTEGCESNSILAVTVTVTLGRDDIQKFTFRYFPNPVTDNLQIVSEEAITNVKVFSLTGQLVMDNKINTQTGIVNMSHLESGVYIVKISFGDIEKTIRVVREK